MRRDDRSRTRISVPAILLLAIGFGASADAQPGPFLSRGAGVPLPGPAPSAVAATPPLVLPAAGGITPSSWDLLREAEAELRRREEDLDRCRARLAAVEADLDRTRQHLERLDAGHAALRDEVRRRMVLLDRVGRGSSARLTLTARDPAEAGFRSWLLRRLVRTDADLARRYLAVRNEAIAVRAELERKRSAQQALERQLEERRRQLTDEIDRHRRLLAALERPAALAALRLEARTQVQGLARALGLQPVAHDPAALRAAAAAVPDVPASFPVLDDELRGGVIVDLPAGTPVAAPDPGTVAFAGILAGYGPSVLIRTPAGDGLLLGHLDTVEVSPGDVLEPGTVVGRAAPSFSPLLSGLLVDRIGAPGLES